VSYIINLKIDIDLLSWSRGAKRRFSKNEKINRKIFIQSNKCGKFQYDWAFFDFSTLPQSFRTKGSQGSKNKDFEKIKKYSPGIHQIYNLYQIST